MHTLVYWVKNMREMGCIPFLGEEDAEVVRYWLLKMGQSLLYIPGPVDMQVACVAQLLLDGVYLWWTMVREKRFNEDLT